MFFVVTTGSHMGLLWGIEASVARGGDVAGVNIKDDLDKMDHDGLNRTTDLCQRWHKFDESCWTPQEMLF
jgi:hypothetical protein